LAKAAFKVTYFRGVPIGKGQVAFSHRVLSDALGYSRGKLGRSLDKLVAMGNIAVKAGRDFSIVTICHWADYQQREDDSWDTDEATDRATCGATDRTTNGTASRAMSGAILKKERIQEPPPPSGATPIDASHEVGEVLLALGMTEGPRVAKAVFAAGGRKADVDSIVAYWRNRPAWGVGALHDRLLAWRPGQSAEQHWPEPKRKANSDPAQRRPDTSAVRRGRGAKEMAAIREKFQPSFEAIADEEKRALFSVEFNGKGDAQWARYRVSGHVPDQVILRFSKALEGIE
jgi:hypothetical protein